MVFQCLLAYSWARGTSIVYSRAENIHAVRARQKGLEIDFRFCAGYYPFFLSSHTLSVLYIHICIYITNLSLCTRIQTHPQSYILSAAVLNSFCRHRPTTTTAFSEINTPTPRTRASAFHPLTPFPLQYGFRHWRRHSFMRVYIVH